MRWVQACKYSSAGSAEVKCMGWEGRGEEQVAENVKLLHNFLALKCSF